MLMGSDSPRNQSASFPTFSSVFPCADFSLENRGMVNRLDLAEEEWSDCWEEQVSSLLCSAASSSDGSRVEWKVDCEGRVNKGGRSLLIRTCSVSTRW